MLPSPSVQITDLWTPFTGFILIVRIFPTKRETKSDGMYKKKKKSVILAPLFFLTWSNRRMRDRDKLVERRTGKLYWEIKLVIFVQLSCSQRNCSVFFTRLCGCHCTFLLMGTAPPPFLFSFSLCCTGSSRGECAVLSWTCCRTDARIRKDS